jgi:hypothetical protein
MGRQHSCGGVAVKLTERNAGDPDVARVGLAEQAVLENHGAERQRHLRRWRVQRRDSEDVDQASDHLGGLAMFCQPAAECLRVRRRRVAVDAVELEHRDDRPKSLPR